jgi:hypothetical protein
MSLETENQIGQVTEAALATHKPVLIDVRCENQLSPDFKNTLRLAKGPDA